MPEVVGHAFVADDALRNPLVIMISNVSLIATADILKAKNA